MASWNQAASRTVSASSARSAKLVDGLEHLGQVLLVVVVPLLLCVTSQQIVAQRLRVRQQAIPLVAQVHGWESRTR